MIQLASFGTLFCVVLAAGFLAYIIHGWERRDDDYHLMHGPNDGCDTCADK